MKKRVILFFILILLCENLFSEPDKNFAYYAVLDEIINPVSVEFLIKAIEKSEKDDAKFLIIQLDTPGGLVESTRILIKKMLNTRIPIIVYIAPPGARAASAGTFITAAADLAAMAPNTRIGAAHPVTQGEKVDKVQMEKITNDLVSYIKNLAQKNFRDDSWVQESVRESKSITENEALQKNVIDLIAKDRKELLEKMNNRNLKNKNIILKTDNVILKEIKMGFKDTVLSYITNPNVAYILLTIGIYGIIYEFATPGFGFSGITGIICLLLAFAALQFFPLNFIGLILLLLGAILFIVDLKVQSHGLITIGAVISILFGSMMLIDIDRSAAPYLVPSLGVIFGTVAALTAIAVILIYLVGKTFKVKPKVGDNHLVNMIGVAKTDLTPEGIILVFGERWNAISLDKKHILKNSKVKIIKVEGNNLLVDVAE